MARFGLVEVLGGAASVVLLVSGAREYTEDRRFLSGARGLDVEIVEVLLGPDQHFHYVVKANDQGRELKLTLPGVEGRGRPWNKVGDRTRVLYNPSAHPTAQWERHVQNDAIIYVGLGTLLPILIATANWLNRLGQERHRRAAVAAQAARSRARPR